MSKQNNLTDFLTDVADAIRAKKGSSGMINPQDFSAEIAALSGGLEVIEMAETTATIEPNKVYVWGMVESLDITLGTSTSDDDFFAFRFRCGKPTMTVVTVNGATWASDTELDDSGNPVLDLGSYYQCEIKGGTSALYARLAHYIPFEDSNVEAVLMSNGIGDGIGITYADAAKVTTISTWFQNNVDITAFEEFAAFSGITSLVKYAFRYCSSLERIKLPSSINKFSGDAVFEYCTALTEIYLPSAITSMATWTFNGCTLLAKVSNLENTQVTSIGDSAFKNCSSLTEIAFPATLTRIEDYAFNGCSSLTEIAFPATLTSIGGSAFNVCKALVTASGLGDTQVTSIGGAAFNGCSSLTEIAFPATLTSIGGSAFNGCTLTNITFAQGISSISVGNSGLGDLINLSTLNADLSIFTSVGSSCFINCSLWDVVTFTNLQSIGSQAFRGTSISQIYLPAIETLAAWSNYEGIFSYCPNLVLVDLGENCATIGSNSFGRLVGTVGNDITLIVRAVTPPELAGPIVNTQWVKAKLAVIYVPDDSLTAYQEATNWSQYADILKPLSEYTEE
ncbi:MAG: leucine-rich repeat domain-containing protein [Candidatus Cryptobacteroides sp.]